MDTYTNNNYLFVYGTLKRGRVRHEILIEENAEFVDEAVLEGYDLYDIGYYPGIVEGEGKVYGEVYKVSDKLIEILDAIEGVEHNLFKRKILPVELMFGFNYIQLLAEEHGKTIEIVNNSENEKEDLIQDFVAVIYSFSAKLYGLRRAKRKTEQIIKEIMAHAE